jgi:hypothetical protein
MHTGLGAYDIEILCLGVQQRTRYSSDLRANTITHRFNAPLKYGERRVLCKLLYLYVFYFAETSIHLWATD